VSIPAFDIGDRVRLGNASGDNDDGSARAPFADTAGVATDPTSVVLTILQPDGSALAYSWPTQDTNDGLLTREAVGRFYRDITLDADGTWSWELRGTGAVETSETGKLYVRWSPFA
jgi:hypothetical protein